MERKPSGSTKANSQEKLDKADGGKQSQLRASNPLTGSGGDMGTCCKMGKTLTAVGRRSKATFHSSHDDGGDSSESGDGELASKHSACSTPNYGDPPSSKHTTSSSSNNRKLKTELSKYKQELKEYTNTTKDLEEKYLKINFELNEMQQKHERFVSNRKSSSNDTETYSDSSSSSMTASEYSLKRKCTQVFERGSSFMTMLPLHSNSSSENLRSNDPFNLKPVPKRKKRVSRSSNAPTVRKTSLYTTTTSSSRRKQSTKCKEIDARHSPPYLLKSCSMHGSKGGDDLKGIYKVLKNVIEINEKQSQQTQTHAQSQAQQEKQQQQVLRAENDCRKLQNTINDLHSEQEQFKSIIEQQQMCLKDYQTRCVKAQHIMDSQQQEIEKLNHNNKQLESEMNTGIDKLRQKIDARLKDVSHLPQLMRDEQVKYEKAVKDNCTLTERMRQMQSESAQMKTKMEDMNRRKAVTLSRLRVAERDLKIFKNYNTSLKHEKRKLTDELKKVREQLDTVQQSSKRSLARQREINEKQRRDLQKRVFELELKLNRSQNSTTALIQERDSLIAELQTQLNTLVHNFEVSQKHIRVLRRHIYSMSGGNARVNTNFINEAA